jgi:hypothetical protein
MAGGVKKVGRNLRGGRKALPVDKANAGKSRAAYPRKKIVGNKRFHGRTRCLFCGQKIAAGMRWCNGDHQARWVRQETAVKRAPAMPDSSTTQAA